ncbi:MAG: serine protease AprX, partial [Gaiellaceae bacterium]|nr:serine protease AprX [Gaiellaceae bacterium]
MIGRIGFRASRASGCAWAGALAAAAAAFVAGSTPAIAAQHVRAAYVPPQLLAAATASPGALFHVIVQGNGAGGSRAVASSVTAEATELPRKGAGVMRRFATFAGVSADLTGQQIVRLAAKSWILAITPDAPLVPTAVGPVPIAPPAIAGAATEGETLSASDGAWSATGPVTFAYQWQRCDPTGAACADVDGATEAAYAVAAADIGSALRVVVLATDPDGSLSTTSDATAPVAAAAVSPPPPLPVASEPLPVASDPPVGATAPVISGDAVVGSSLTADPGSWTGTEPLAFAYQWQRCAAACVDLPQATLPTYVVGDEDAASMLRVVVTATGPGGAASSVSATSAPVARWSSLQVWPYAAGLPGIWAGAFDSELPAIAIVDSGVDSSLADFAGRTVEQVHLGSLTPDSPGDGRGHGTFVAAIAAGSAAGHAGAAPRANIVSLDVLNDLGEGRTSDVIAAADWILQNKDLYRIRVANFSLQGTTASSIRYDPLDRAVENLWLGGVVVVAAAGNYAVDGTESGVRYAPANDPFVITVGAADVGGTVTTADDVAAPWSAYGYTPDGFAKPELAAPGRYLVAAVPPGA